MFLAINTSTLQFSLALLDGDGTLLCEFFKSEGKGHFGGLIPILDWIIKTSNANIRNLKGLAVATGPGSFTGLRVGLSFAKGLCQNLDIPIVGIPSLMAIANQLPFADRPIIPVLESRKDEFFVAEFEWGDDNILLRKTEDAARKFEDLPSLFKKPCFFIGNDFKNQAPIIENALGSRAMLAPPHCWSLRASSIGSLALERFQNNEYDNPRHLKPIYLRPPEIRHNPHTQTVNAG
jgi:tRNA threonylcarbamoyladenosine biosynthesis protein TsaB